MSGTHGTVIDRYSAAGRIWLVVWDDDRGEKFVVETLSPAGEPLEKVEISRDGSVVEKVSLASGAIVYRRH